MAECKVCGASVDEGQEYCADCKPSEGGEEQTPATEGGETPAEEGGEEEKPEEGGEKTAEEGGEEEKPEESEKTE